MAYLRIFRSRLRARRDRGIMGSKRQAVKGGDEWLRMVSPPPPGAKPIEPWFEMNTRTMTLTTCPPKLSPLCGRRWSEGRCTVAEGRSIALHIFSGAENQMELRILLLSKIAPPKSFRLPGRKSRTAGFSNLLRCVLSPLLPGGWISQDLA